MPAEQRTLAEARRVFAIDDLALPSAVLGIVGAEIIEIGITAADAPVLQHHDAGVAAINAVEHADVDGIESIADAIRADTAGRRRIGIVDRRQHALEDDPGECRGAAFGMEFAALPAAAEGHEDIVDGIQRRVRRIIVVARHHHLRDDLLALHIVVADEGRAGIAAIELAILGREHDAAAGAARRLECEFVESLQQHAAAPENTTSPPDRLRQVPLAMTYALSRRQDYASGTLRSNALQDFS